MSEQGAILMGLTVDAYERDVRGFAGRSHDALDVQIIITFSWRDFSQLHCCS
jgi:hypothetical protein